MATYKPPVQKAYQPPGRAATGRQFGQAARPGSRSFGEVGSLRPDTMTGFDRRDEVTGMQNEQNRESSLYNRIFRQQSRASRKGDINAGIGALDTMERARAAGVTVGGIKSFDRNRNFAAGTLQNINEQTAMMEGQGQPDQGGGQWQDDGQGGSNFVERTAAPVSGAVGVPEVPGMQNPPEASMADSFQDKVSKLGSRADPDGSLFSRLTGVDPNQDPNIVVLGSGSTEAYQGSPETRYDKVGSGTSGPEASPSPTPSLSDDFAKQFPLTSKLIGTNLGSRPANYDPSTDTKLTRFKENESKFGRDEAMRREVSEATDPIRVEGEQGRFDRDNQRKRTLLEMSEARDLANQPPILEEDLFGSDSEYLSNPEDIRWRDFLRAEKAKEKALLKERREAE